MLLSPTEKIENVCRYIKLLHRKKVLLVGGKPCQTAGQENAADLVVRTNAHWEKDERIDILYYCGQPDWQDKAQKLFKSELKALVVYAHATHSKTMIEKALARGLIVITYDSERPTTGVHKFLEPEDKWLEAFIREYDMLPLTGVLALRHLTHMPVQSVYVMGMDFYRKGEHMPLRPGGHPIAPHVRFLEDITSRDNRVALDEELKAAMALFRNTYEAKERHETNSINITPDPIDHTSGTSKTAGTAQPAPNSSGAAS